MSAILIAAAACLVLVPSPPARQRVRVLRGTVRRASRLTAGRLLPAVPVGVFVLVGPGQAIATTIATALAHRMIRLRRIRLESAQTRADVIAALDVMVAELRVGAPPAHACRTAAVESPAPVARVLEQLAGRVELGGRVGTGALPTDSSSESWSKVVSAWELADTHGLPIADPLDAIRSDLSARASFAARAHASLAGARATAIVLAGLPCLGIALGQAIGADPIGVLTGDGLGAILLPVGVALACAGLWWSDRIATAATVAA